MWIGDLNRSSSGLGTVRVDRSAMAIFHVATIAPTKEELIAEWAPSQEWGPKVLSRGASASSSRCIDAPSPARALRSRSLVGGTVAGTIGCWPR